MRIEEMDAAELRQFAFDKSMPGATIDDESFQKAVARTLALGIRPLVLVDEAQVTEATLNGYTDGTIRPHQIYRRVVFKAINFLV